MTPGFLFGFLLGVAVGGVLALWIDTTSAGRAGLRGDDD